MTFSLGGWYPGNVQNGLKHTGLVSVPVKISKGGHTNTKGNTIMLKHYLLFIIQTNPIMCCTDEEKLNTNVAPHIFRTKIIKSPVKFLKI